MCHAMARGRGAGPAPGLPGGDRFYRQPGPGVQQRLAQAGADDPGARLSAAAFPALARLAAQRPGRALSSIAKCLTPYAKQRRRHASTVCSNKFETAAR
ncbi:hypothetical protein PCLA_03f0210 [Pseudomonas citronellolis]|nr:hypothetical protein PCLA_03f0210 [Pseudomonas citronellolis]